MTTRKIVTLFAIAFVLAIGAVIAGNFAYDNMAEDPTTEIRANLLTSEQIEALITEQVFEQADDPRLSKLYGAMLTQASVCHDCERFWEHSSGSHHAAFPVVSPTVGYGSRSYTVVLGQLSYNTSNTLKPDVRPTLVVYVQNDDGTMTRLGNETHTYPLEDKLQMGPYSGDQQEVIDEAVNVFGHYLFASASDV
jgi:hypothetical protein